MGIFRMLLMNTLKLVAILLIVGGGIALTYGGFSYTKETHTADIGDVHLAVHERQRVNIPVWAGLGAVVGVTPDSSPMPSRAGSHRTLAGIRSNQGRESSID